MDNSIIRDHPYREQLLRDPDYFLRRCAPGAYRELQDQRFHRSDAPDPVILDLCKRVRAMERKVNLLTEIVVRLAKEPGHDQ